MRHIPSLLIPLLALTPLACGEVPSGPDRPSSVAARLDPTQPALRRTVLPSATDAAITLALDPHVVRVPAGPTIGRLFVYLPSSRAVPSVSEIVQEEAARLGYHVIGLSYPNNPGLAAFCPTSADPQACYQDTRLEVITGEDRSTFVSVSAANSIDNRLLTLLAHLHGTWPAEGWDRFLGPGGIRWQHVVVGGHSQGAGHAAMIAKLRLVRGVIMLSGVTDGSTFGGGVTSGTAAWVTIGATPVERYFGLAHQQDHAFRQSILANWGQLGMAGASQPVTPESATPPYGGANAFVTNVTPSTGNFIAPGPHGSTGVDMFTPVVADVPVLRGVWRYMLGWCPGSGVGNGANEVVPCDDGEET